VTRARTHRSRAGLTLVELLIALAITVIAGLAIATVTTAMARGVTQSNDARGALQRALTAHARLREYLTTSLCVLAHDEEQGVAIWLNDDRANGQVNISEVRVFWFDPADDSGDMTLERVTFPEAWDEDTLAANDITLADLDDPFTVMASMRDLGHTTTTTLADGIAGVGVASSHDSLQASNRVVVELDVRVGATGAERVLIAAGLANHRIPE